MTTSLAQALVDAAAKAIHVADCHCDDWSPADPAEDHSYLDQAQAAVAAVLETLAKQWDAERRDISKPADTRTLAAITVSINKLRKLAAEIREGT